MRAALLACGLSLICGIVSAADEKSLDCQVLYRAADGVYIDAGTKAGLEKGATGWLRRNADPIARFELVEVTSGQSFLRPTGVAAVELPKAGERIVLILDAPRKEPPCLFPCESPEYPCTLYRLLHLGYP